MFRQLLGDSHVNTDDIADKRMLRHIAMERRKWMLIGRKRVLPSSLQCRYFRDKVITPGKPKKSDTAYDRKKKRYPFRRRADIEPVVGHLKADHRMRDKFLSDRESDTVNTMLAATGWNLKKMMKDLARKSAGILFALMRILSGETRYKLMAA